jgi:hypothetical protein
LFAVTTELLIDAIVRQTLPPRRTKVIVYLGQNVIETGDDEGEPDDSSK